MLGEDSIFFKFLISTTSNIKSEVTQNQRHLQKFPQKLLTLNFNNIQNQPESSNSVHQLYKLN
jgi:hypothetical protein